MSIKLVNLAKSNGKNKYYAVIARNSYNIYYGIWDEINFNYISGKSVQHKSFVDQNSAKLWIENELQSKGILLQKDISKTYPNYGQTPIANQTSYSPFLNPFPLSNQSSAMSPFPIVSHPLTINQFPLVNQPSVMNQSIYLPSPNQFPSFYGYTDGSFIKRKINSETKIFGGWAYAIVQMIQNSEQLHKQNSGKVNPDLTDPTNNRAELTAIKMILQDGLSNNISIIFSDSEYSINSITVWYKNWQRNGWKTTTGGDVKNKDLIEEILQLKTNKNINFQHIRAHVGHKYNELVDTLAKEAALKL